MKVRPEQLVGAITEVKPQSSLHLKYDSLLSETEREHINVILRLHRNGFTVNEIAERVSRVRTPKQLEAECGVSVHKNPVYDDGDGVETAHARQIQAYERQKRRIKTIISVYGGGKP